MIASLPGHLIVVVIYELPRQTKKVAFSVLAIHVLAVALAVRAGGGR
jgi:hypothetical protein